METKEKQNLMIKEKYKLISNQRGLPVETISRYQAQSNFCDLKCL